MAGAGLYCLPLSSEVEVYTVGQLIGNGKQVAPDATLTFK
jgi:hypothetical protein